MPQKKRTTTKRKSSPKRKTKKTKVYIPANSVISLCAIVVGVCTALLLTSTLASNRKEKLPPQKAPVVAEKKPATQKAASKPTQPVQKKQPEKTQAPATAAKPSQQEKTAPVEPKTAVPETKPQVQPVKAVPSTPVETEKKQAWDIPNFPPAVNGAKIVVIFDDGGQNLSQLEKCISLPFPVTVAVLPKLVHSKETAERVRRSGNEVMLHQPMQSINLNVNPGPGAITPAMSENEIKSTVFQNVYEIGPIVGMNNHEGSLITADAEKIATVMQLCSEQGLFFLDSRTNKDTQVPYVAQTLGYGYYERNGQFLDNTKKREDILNIIEKNVQIANRQGVVIMIGHVWSADVLPGILREVYPVLSAKGYTFTTVSKSGAYKR